MRKWYIFTVINRIKNQDLNGIDEFVCSRILNIMLTIFVEVEDFERLKEK